MSRIFRIVKHVVPSQHIREWPRATADGDNAPLRLSVKQYIPLDNPSPRAGDVTVIAAHANGFPKELYEPLWEELWHQSHKRNFRIRGIWIADVTHQGQSGILNQNLLGNDPSWWDHSRDLLYLINQKQDEMPAPLFGIGHSMGGSQLANLSLIHPRLFAGLVLLDPVIQQETASILPATLSTHRKDTWPSREALVEAIKKSQFYSKWDPRVLERWLKYGIQELSTGASGEQSPVTPVTLVTTKHQEVFTFVRPTYHGDPKLSPLQDRTTYPDLQRDYDGVGFYRPEPPSLFRHLPELRPSLLYVFGEKSELSPPEWREQKMALTGTGIGGSGGAAEGKVKSVVLKDCGHLVAMEQVTECAEAAAEFMEGELQAWKDQKAHVDRIWGSKTQAEKVTIDDEWKKAIDKIKNGDKPDGIPSKI